MANLFKFPQFDGRCVYVKAVYSAQAYEIMDAVGFNSDCPDCGDYCEGNCETVCNNPSFPLATPADIAAYNMGELGPDAVCL
jgi:hypothetical protein